MVKLVDTELKYLKVAQSYNIKTASIFYLIALVHKGMKFSLNSSSLAVPIMDLTKHTSLPWRLLGIRLQLVYFSELCLVLGYYELLA